MVLIFYYKDMLEKVTMQKPSNSQFFHCYQKNPVKCSACAVTQKIAIEKKIAFSEIRPFLENQSLEFHEIWHKNTLGDK